MLLNCLHHQRTVSTNQRHLQQGETSEAVYLIKEKLAAAFGKYFLNSGANEGTMCFV